MKGKERMKELMNGQVVRLMVDLGNSETRAIAQVLSAEGSVAHTRGYLLDNRFVVEPIQTKSSYTQYFSSEDFDKTNSNILEVDLSDKFAGAHSLVIWGELAYTNLSRKLRPVANLSMPKAGNPLSYITLYNLIDRVVDWVSSLKPSMSKVEVASDLVFEVSLLVPPAQVEKARTLFGDNLVGAVNYVNIYDGVEIETTVSTVNVLAEGYASFYSTFVSYDTLRVRPQQAFSELSERNVLIIDFGEGTTDLIGVSKQRLLEGFKHTIKIGGSSVINRVRSMVNGKYDLNLNPSAFKDVLSTHEVHYGAKTYDVSEEVTNAILMVASELANEVLNYMNSADVGVEFFDRLLLVGGGVVSPSKGEGQVFDTISHALLSQLQGYLPELTLVDVSKLEEPAIAGVPFDLTSPRYLNILGLLTAISLLSR